MKQISYATFPTLWDDLDAFQDEINTALKRSWLALGGIVVLGTTLLSFLIVYASK